MNDRKNVIIVLFSIIIVVLGMKIKNLNSQIENINKTNTSNSLIENIIDDDTDIENIVNTIDITENKKSSSTENTIENVCIDDEKELETEETNIEIEGFELENEDNISYDGDKAKTWNVELGDYNGLTYYSQIDNRWKNKLYTSTQNSKQTIGNSGCGPTVSAMIVSSIKGNITPDVMANLFVKNGYRSPNNGTYWSAYRAIADEFNIGYTETSNINKAIELLKNNNYVACSVGNGLFTSGGHYILIVGIEDNVLKIYDPYLYNGKFDVPTRKGKIVVEGNTIYCSINNFKKYANYKGFFCYKKSEIKNSNNNSNTSSKNNNSNNNISKYKFGQRVLVKIPIKIAWQGSKKSYDDSLVDCNGYQFWIKNSLIKNNYVYGIGTICYDGGEKDIVQIFDRQFWCLEKYMSNNF